AEGWPSSSSAWRSCPGSRRRWLTPTGRLMSSPTRQRRPCRAREARCDPPKGVAMAPGHAAFRFPMAALLVVLAAGSVLAERPRPPYPKAARDRYEAARRSQEQKRYREALGAYDEAARLGMADYPMLRVQRGECLRYLKDYRAAIASHTAAIADGS